MQSPLLTPAETEELWRRAHGELARLLARVATVGESAPPGKIATVDERLLQVVWAEQLLRHGELVTASGKVLEIIEPGRWNTSRGPDFLDARIRLAGEERCGDVEIHLDSADWTRHGHHQDFEYNPVVLHVVLRAHDDRPFDEKQNAGRLERLVVEPFLEHDLETIRATINPADYPYGRPDGTGICHQEFLRLPPDQLDEFFLLSGRSRMEQKIARFAAQRRVAPLSQVVYQALLTAQGFKASKTLYFLLSKRVPLEELEQMAAEMPPGDRGDFRLSILLYVAGILPAAGGSDFLASLDEESHSFADRLARFWALARPYYSDRILPPTKRWYAGMRPAGFPTRRLAAVSRMLEALTDADSPLVDRLRHKLLSVDLNKMGAKDLKKFFKEFVQLLQPETRGHYFETHFTLGGKKQKSQALLGEPAAQSLAFNVFLPLLILDARERRDRRAEEATWIALHLFPALETNSVTRFMARRLFAETATGRQFTLREIHQQALFKIFTDCCAENERTCDHCTFLALGEKLRSAPISN